MKIKRWRIQSADRERWKIIRWYGKYCKGCLKHKKETGFLIYMNVAICGSRFVAVSVTVSFLFKKVFPIMGQNLFQTQNRASSFSKGCHFNIFLFLLIHLLPQIATFIYILRIFFPFCVSDNPYSTFRQRQDYPIIFQRSLRICHILFTVTQQFRTIVQDSIKQPAKPQINLSTHFCTKNSQRILRDLIFLKNEEVVY